MLRFERITWLGCVLFSLATAARAGWSVDSTIPATEGARGPTAEIPFVANVGQADRSIGFYAETFSGTVQITTEGEIRYSVPAGDPGDEPRRRIVIGERFVTTRTLRPQGGPRATARVSYFRGDDPSQWYTGIPTYRTVELGEVREGIEAVIEARGNNIEKRFLVRPGADPADIEVQLEGTSGIRRTAAGQLQLSTGTGVLAFTRPIAFQEGPEGRVPVEVEYTVDGLAYGFAVGDYDRERVLVIDPLIASTFYGGSGEDRATSMAVDSAGTVYIAGYGDSGDLPVPGGTTGPNGSNDILLAKFSPDLTSLLAATYLGGSGMEGTPFSVEESVIAIAVDGDDNVYVCGETTSTDFPMASGGAQPTHGGGWDVCIARLDASLQLQAASYLGGAEEELGLALTTNEENGSTYVYVTGETESFGFPTTINAFKTDGSGVSLWSSDAFVSKLDENLANLVGSTFLGGGSGEKGLAIAGNANGIYVAGRTDSADFPRSGYAVNGYQDNMKGSRDAFVVRFDPSLQGLHDSTFLGGSVHTTINDEDHATVLALASDDAVYVGGETSSSDFPVSPGAFSASLNGNVDCFLSRLNWNLHTLDASTFFGGDSGAGAESDQPASIDLAANGDVIVAGFTMRQGFPTTPWAYDPYFDPGDDFQAFVSRFAPDLASLPASTLLGGSGGEQVYSVLEDAQGKILVTGLTNSVDFPTVSGCYDESYNHATSGMLDAFVAKLDGYLSGQFRPFCFGDPGAGTPCPCGNDNDGTVPGSGCANGVFTSGAQLSGSGIASVSADTLVLSTTGLEQNNSGLYFQADNDLSPGSAWGDGLRCAGGNLKRLQVRFADAAGHSGTTIGISTKVGNVAPGDTKRYQCWYRTTVNPPCGAGLNDFNSSNGLEITWVP